MTFVKDVNGDHDGIVGSKPMVKKPSDRAWWKSSTVYQVYPASFADHAANGHGTLLGIKSKVGYLKSLGVDVVWLSPIYESPQADMGYDISDYEKPDPRYGTLEDWDSLRDEVHKHGMKLVMDLVINHSSDEHAWFQESRSSLTNPKRDWYIWRDGVTGMDEKRSPPNNWKSIFGPGSAWEWDPTTEQYYLHTFLKEQPDLNWENVELRQELWKMMHYWLKRGADGFRMDVINFIGKHPEYPDAPMLFPSRDYQPFNGLSINREIVHEYLREMNREVLSKYDCFAVGETPGGDPVSAYAGYSIPANNELQMVFHFHHQKFDRAQGGFGRVGKPNWKLTELKAALNEWQVDMEKAGGWNSNYLENHDQPRTVSRITSDHPDDRAKCAKLLAMFHCSLTGTIFVYQGQEIGLCNVPRHWGEEEYKDIETIQHLAGERMYRRRAGEENPDVSDVLKGLRETARDNGRTPMQWDTSLHAGFSKTKPWMRVHNDYAQGWNVEQQSKDPNSVWRFWQKMLGLRKQYEALIYGTFTPLDPTSEETYVYVRDDPTISQRLLVVLNLCRAEGRGKAVTYELPADLDVSNARLIIGNGQVTEGAGIQGRALHLAPFEGRIYLL